MRSHIPALAFVGVFALIPDPPACGQNSRIKVVDSDSPAASPTPRVETADPSDGTFSIVFPASSDVREVLSYYERLTGKRVVTSAQVVGPLPLIVNKPVSRAEAATAIEQALFANQFPIVDLDKNTVQILGIGQSPHNVPIPVYSKLEDLPQSERAVTMVFKLKHRDVVEFARKLQQTRPAPSWAQATNVSPDVQSRSIVVTDRTSSIRQMALLIAELDVPDTAAK